MIKLNPLPSSKVLIVGDVVRHRSKGFKAVVLWKEIRPKKDLTFFLLGWLFGYIPEKEEVFFLVSLKNDQLILVDSDSLRESFTSRGESLSGSEMLALLKNHDLNVANKQLFSLHAIHE